MPKNPFEFRKTQRDSRLYACGLGLNNVEDLWNLLGLRSNEPVHYLDVGYGEGRFLQELCNNFVPQLSGLLVPYGIDLYFEPPKAQGLVAERASLLNQTIVKPNSLTHTTASFSLGYYGFNKASLLNEFTELSNLMKIGGKLFITLPIDEGSYKESSSVYVTNIAAINDPYRTDKFFPVAISEILNAGNFQINSVRRSLGRDGRQTIEEVYAFELEKMEHREL